MAKRDYYEILGVKRKAADKEIKSAYRKLARKYHPDFNKDDKKSEDKFKEISEAYAVLTNDEARRKYDQFGHSAGPGAAQGFDFSGFDFNNPGGSFRGFGNTYQSGGMQDIIQELFGNFGGGRRGPQGFPGAGRSRRGPAKGRDVESEMTIEFMEAILGTRKSVTLNSGLSAQNLTFNIPAGLKNGEKIRLRGKGMPSPSGLSGDLLIKINIGRHPHFRRDGHNLRVTVGISIADAIVGANIPVPTPYGDTTISIPPGTQGGQVFRIANNGIRRKNQDAGNLLVTVKILVPKEIDQKSKELIEQFNKLNPIESGVQ
jgi:DnaJ-class molecular chaperone